MTAYICNWIWGTVNSKIPVDLLRMLKVTLVWAFSWPSISAWYCTRLMGNKNNSRLSLQKTFILVLRICYIFLLWKLGIVGNSGCQNWKVDFSICERQIYSVKSKNAHEEVFVGEHLQMIFFSLLNTHLEMITFSLLSTYRYNHAGYLNTEPFFFINLDWRELTCLFDFFLITLAKIEEKISLKGNLCNTTISGN